MRYNSRNRAPFIACQAGLVPKVEGIPGASKTVKIGAFAQACNRYMYTLVGANREAVDIGGAPRFEEHPTRFCWIAPDWVHEANKRPSLIFLDELTCNNEERQAAMLRVASERIVGDTPLDPGTWIFAACNSADHAANGHDLSPSMANRLLHFTWDSDFRYWVDGMVSGRFAEIEFPLLPANWEQYLPRWKQLIAAFITHRPAIWEQVPANRGLAGMAWPSQRTWLYAAIGLAATEACGDTHRKSLADLERETRQATGVKPTTKKSGKSKGGPKTVSEADVLKVSVDDDLTDDRLEDKNGERAKKKEALEKIGQMEQELTGSNTGMDMLSACVGTAAAIQLFQYIRHLDLPDPGQMLDDACLALKKDKPYAWTALGRPDLVMATLHAVTATAQERETDEAFQGAFHIMNSAWDELPDVTISCLQGLHNSHPLAGKNMPIKLIKQWAPFLAKVRQTT